MNLQEAADHLDLPKKKLWRAVKAKQLKATRKQVGNRWEFRVTAQDLEEFRLGHLVSVELPALRTERDGTTQDGLSLEAQLAQALAERDALARRLAIAEKEATEARSQAQEACLYLKEARTVIGGWEARRKRASFWQQLIAK